MLFCILYKIGYILANVLPLNAAYWLAERVSMVHYHAAKKDRDAVAGNLSIVLGKDIEECRYLAQKAFRNFGMYLVDFFRMAMFTKESMQKRVRFFGIEKIDNILRQGKGAVLLSCHLGNWEMGGVVTAMLGYDISAVALTHLHKSINDFFIRQREVKGLKVITMCSVMKRCVSVLLKERGLLALVGDRDFTNNGIMLDFFGMPTSIPKGPAMFALKTNSPIVPVFFVRDDRFNYKLIIDEPIYVEKAQGVEDGEIIKEATMRFVPIMEKYIRAYPEQWLVFRKFWESPANARVL